MTVADLIRKHSISQGTYYRWKSKFGGMDVSRRVQPIRFGVNTRPSMGTVVNQLDIRPINIC